MDRVRNGELPWTRIDDLHRMILDELLAEAGITSIAEDDIDHLNRAWHRLDPWPDSVARPDTAQGAVRHHHAVERQRVAADQHGQTRRAAVGLRDLGRAVPSLQARPRGIPRLRRPARRAARAADAGRRPPQRSAGSARRRPENRLRREAAGVWTQPASSQGAKTANSISRQRIFPTSPTSWASENSA